jgi:tetratricopeptide (TPR) repeat protein
MPQRKDATMTRSAFFLVVCITAAIVVCSLALAANPGNDNEPAIENALAVQKAMLQARDLVVRKDYKQAVDVLEANLARADGDRRYLTTLRDAYRSYIRELALANKADLLEVYQKRLRILDDNEPAAVGGAAPQVTAGVTPATPKTVTPGQSPLAADKSAKAPAAAPSYVARGKMPDPFDPINEVKFPAAQVANPGAAKDLIAKGDAEYQLKHYAEAKQCYDKALLLDGKALDSEARGRWSYCQLSLIVDQANRFPAEPCDWAKMEADVKSIMQTAPQFTKSGENILAEMTARRTAVPAGQGKPGPQAAVAVKHFAKGANGYQLAETSHFRVFHNQTADYAEKVVQIAEATRVQMSRRWFGKDGDDWQPKCDIFLHANAAEYSERTRQNPAFPGHSRIELDERNGRVVTREIHMRCDNPAMLDAVLPHETTHVVLAGNFGNKHVPRWVDEGVAVLTEPLEKVQQHKKNLAKSLQSRELIPLRDLVQLSNFPEAKQITVFYAQSVALVDYLTALKGPQVFTQFVREAMRDGYDGALKKHYGFQSFPEFQDRFTERIIAEANGKASIYAER